MIRFHIYDFERPGKGDFTFCNRPITTRVWWARSINGATCKTCIKKWKAKKGYKNEANQG